MKKDLHPLTHAAAGPGRQSEPTEAEIQKAAYHLWQQKGCPDGCDLDTWLEARELLRHHVQASAAKAAGPAPARVPATRPTVQIHFPGPQSTAPFPPAGPGPASTHLDFRHASHPEHHHPPLRKT